MFNAPVVVVCVVAENGVEPTIPCVVEEDRVGGAGRTRLVVPEIVLAYLT